MNQIHMYTCDNDEQIELQFVGDGTFISERPVSIVHSCVDNNDELYRPRTIRLKLSEVRSLIRSLGDMLQLAEQLQCELMTKNSHHFMEQQKAREITEQSKDKR